MSKSISLIILAAGNSSRFEKKAAKQWLRIGDVPLWLFVANKLIKMYDFKKCVITSHPDDFKYMQNFIESDGFFEIAVGDKERQLSLKNAMDKIGSEFVLVTDVARACIDKGVVDRLLDESDNFDCVVPYIKVADTVLFNDIQIDRDALKRVQTPQLSKTKILKEALKSNKIFTDESTLIASFGGKIGFIKGSEEATKITHSNDLNMLSCLEVPSNDVFVGNGFDVHEFEKNRKMVLGGVEIECDFGFKAHSDGDVAIHALIDSLLGAAGMGDIGELFPDTSEKYKNIDSKILLKESVDKIKRCGFEIVNADITIIAQTPKIEPYKQKMKEILSKIMNVPLNRVNIKATTTEKLGFVGRKEGVAVMAASSLKYFDWKKK